MCPLILLAQLLAVEPPSPIVLGQEPTEVILVASEDADLRRRLSEIVADPAENLILRLERVTADRDPEVSWEIYVASSDPADCDNVPALAGIVSLYGAPPDAELSVPLDAAITAGEPVGLKVVFRPISGLEVDGEPMAPTVRSPVRIGRIRLETEEATSRHGAE